MRFVFPKNYNFNNKLFGVIDYSTAIIDVIWILFVFLLSNIIFNDLNFKIIFCIIFSFPVLIFSIIGFNHENISYVLTYILKFILHKKIYLYKKF